VGSGAEAVKNEEPGRVAIGLHVVGKIPKQQAAIVAAITWAVGALPAVFGALRAD
jgi:hypothetical protein